MNDFTKEELETLLQCVSLYAQDEPDDFISLFEKLSLMINNYCDHNAVIGVDFPAHKCMKCGAYWE